MPNLESFVEFIGIFNDQHPTIPVMEAIAEDGVKWGEAPNPHYCVRQGFRVQHEGKEDLANFINRAFQELVVLGGMMVHKEEPHEQFDFSNQVFIPMHRLSRIECSVKRITSVLENPDALETEERKN